ncbi:hypothetical protein [Streptomyces sp. NPDC001787]|uniref:hypothetical protein n=1 Tax=Streptomyces sp. NPDC001787 TaxID=3154523 RepID=UPI00331D0EA0
MIPLSRSCPIAREAAQLLGVSQRTVERYLAGQIRRPRPRARFGFASAAGSSDDGRVRQITQHLPPVYAARLFDAQAAGATHAELQAVAAAGLQVEFTDIDYVELDYS